MYEEKVSDGNEDSYDGVEDKFWNLLLVNKDYGINV